MNMFTVDVRFSSSVTEQIPDPEPNRPAAELAVEDFRRITLEHHWRLRTLESHLALTRKRLASLEARESLSKIGRAARPPGLEFRSQYGEDALVWELTGGQTEGHFVEAGAVDGLRLSVTAAFESIGWTGLLVEPIADAAARCKTNRPGSRTIRAALASEAAEGVSFNEVRGAEVYSARQLNETHRHLAESQGGTVTTVSVRAITLDQALEEASADDWPSIDLVVLDLEGGETDALHGFDLGRWKPSIMILEDHDPPDRSALVEVVTASGYRLAGSLQVNRVFVREDRDDVLARAVAIPGF